MRDLEPVKYVEKRIDDQKKTREGGIIASEVIKTKDFNIQNQHTQFITSKFEEIKQNVKYPAIIFCEFTLGSNKDLIEKKMNQLIHQMVLFNL